MRRSQPQLWPTLVALIVAAGALAAWQHTLGGTVAPHGLEPFQGEQMIWVGPGIGPVGVGGDIAASDILVVGDSRVGHGFHLSIANRFGLGRFGTIWGGGTETAFALLPLMDMPPRAVVVCLSPLGLIGPQNDKFKTLLREPHPGYDATASPRAVREWAAREVQVLTAEGLSEAEAGAAIDWWVKRQRLARHRWLAEQRWFDTVALDKTWSYELDRWRALRLQTIEPTAWQQAWFKRPNFNVSSAVYRQATNASKAEVQRAAAKSIVGRLGELKARGWKIACVRLPVEPVLRKIEDESGTGALLASIPAMTALPYLDLGSWDGATLDGSHLAWPGADRATRAILRWLRDDLGWRH
ncbi:MAG: hypothetical protein R3F49_06040 [Planctomycetota bacterium]